MSYYFFDNNFVIASSRRGHPELIAASPNQTPKTNKLFLNLADQKLGSQDNWHESAVIMSRVNVEQIHLLKTIRGKQPWHMPSKYIITKPQGINYI